MSRITMGAGSEPETGPCLPRLQSQSQSEALRVTAARGAGELHSDSAAH